MKQEFEKYNNMLTPERVEHIKENGTKCDVCKDVAITHSSCVIFNEPFSAALFIEAVKKYISIYP